jgi:hypothetical protein
MFNNFSPRIPYLLCDYVKKCGRSRKATDINILRRMRIACCIIRAIDTHSYRTRFMLTPFVRRQKCASVLLIYVHFLSRLHVTTVWFILNFSTLFQFPV